MENYDAGAAYEGDVLPHAFIKYGRFKAVANCSLDDVDYRLVSILSVNIFNSTPEQPGPAAVYLSYDFVHAGVRAYAAAAVFIEKHLASAGLRYQSHPVKPFPCRLNALISSHVLSQRDDQNSESQKLAATR